MNVSTRRIIGFGLAGADLDGPIVWRMFNRAIAKQTPPKYLSSDHDPPTVSLSSLAANLLILEVDEIKAVPCAPCSHVFIERLIGTYGAISSIRHYSGTSATLNETWIITRLITTNTAVTPGWAGLRRLSAVANLHIQSRTLSDIADDGSAMVYFRRKPQPN